MLWHSPESLPTVNLAVLAICPSERKLVPMLVELELLPLEHSSMLMLPVMSLWRSSSRAALKSTEFCSLATWVQGTKDNKWWWRITQSPIWYTFVGIHSPPQLEVECSEWCCPLKLQFPDQNQKAAKEKRGNETESWTAPCSLYNLKKYTNMMQK